MKAKEKGQWWACSGHRTAVILSILLILVPAIIHGVDKENADNIPHRE